MPAASAIALTASVAAGAFAALDGIAQSVARRRLALRANRAVANIVSHAVEGELRDLTCAALVSAANADAALRRWFPPRADSPFAARTYGIRTQLMLAAGRSIQRDGTLNLKRYRLELAYLARYSLGASFPLQRTLVRARRRRLGRRVATLSLRAEPLLAALPLGLVHHDQPGRAAALAADLVAITHRDPEVRQAAGLVAALAARLTQRGSAPLSLSARRLLIDRVSRDAGGPDGAASLALGAVPEQAGQPLETLLDRVRLGRRAIEVLPIAFQIALHRDSIHDALADARLAGRFGLDIAPLAVALQAIRNPSESLKSCWPGLQDRAEIELLGERLSLVEPSSASVRPASRRKGRATRSDRPAKPRPRRRTPRE